MQASLISPLGLLVMLIFADIEFALTVKELTIAVLSLLVEIKMLDLTDKSFFFS